MKYFRLTMKI